jgi:hypothetical protein
MYHPSAMLTIAHTREAELLREAQAMSLAPANPRPLPAFLWRLAATGLLLAAVAAALGVWAG